ncbi:hypothetical protein CCHL11_10359 [Colletotrichum chlorophyti]|uniref:Uncharacterized protein n=1 Tax=Colletotrichum chlorophyti TaxID=708187 RepID=A0A1Q8RAA5_9PEZI|nr:hypothetical protein CCHL11_10359 [Colletotrichum chlorophyti]
MSSSAPRSSNATESTKLLTITTPWIEPSDCSTQWTTSTSFQKKYGGTTVTQAWTISNPAASCYPPGWDDEVPERRLNFRPGVCPEGWNYQGLGEQIPLVASTAYCCQSGFTHSRERTDGGSSSLAAVCERSGWATAAASGTSGENQIHTAERHSAWALTWAASDTATLTPKLPTLTSGMRVPTWTPGEKIPKGEYDQFRNDNLPYIGDGAYYFLMIGMPIIGALMIGSCMWCCIRKCKKNRREKRATMAATEVNLTSIPK